MQPETQIPKNTSNWHDKAALALLILVGMDLFVLGPFLSFAIWPWPYLVIPPMLLIALGLKLTSSARRQSISPLQYILFSFSVVY